MLYTVIPWCISWLWHQIVEHIYLKCLFLNILNFTANPFLKPFAVICHIKKVIAKIRRVKVENFTLNPYTLDNLTYNIKQYLDSNKGF